MIKLNHDTFLYRFVFPKPDMEFGLHIGGHVRFYADIKHPDAPNGELVSRKYTPVSAIHEKGSIDFVIKIYRKNVHPKFPNGGIMTTFLEDELKVGDFLEMEGPLGKLAYEGNANFIINGKPVRKTKIGAVAGGSGITPIYQVIKAAYDADENLPISLIFGNKTPDDILLRDELEHYAKGHS